MVSPIDLEQGLGVNGAGRSTSGLSQDAAVIEPSHPLARNGGDLEPQQNIISTGATPPSLNSLGSGSVSPEDVGIRAEPDEPAALPVPSSSFHRRVACSRGADDSLDQRDGKLEDGYITGEIQPKILGPKPKIAWECVRTRPAKEFPGREILEAWNYSLSLSSFYKFKVASFKIRHTGLRIVPATTSERIGREKLRREKLRMEIPSKAAFMAALRAAIRAVIRVPLSILALMAVPIAAPSVAIFGITPYRWKRIKTSDKSPPPKGLYVVVGIFSNSGALVREVIIYATGQSLSRQLVIERRRLFRLPILRKIKAFGLYKCDPVSRTHTKVGLRAEETDCLASLFEHVEKWEKYYKFRVLLRLASLAMTLGTLSQSGAVLVLILVLVLLTLVILLWRIAKSTLSGRVQDIILVPTIKEEIEWRDWIQDNINEGHDDPSKGRCSLLCVVGWSKLNIVLFVVFPFLLAAVGSIIFGVMWSIDRGSHKGDLQGAWAVASFIITLAAALGALLGLAGSFSL